MRGKIDFVYRVKGMKCPGQDSQYWNEDAIFDVDCPECGASVEFYKDDTTRKCPKCRKRFVNPKMDFGCAAYCQFAEQCIGTLPEEFVGSQDNLLKDKVAVEIKRFFGSDFKRIGHITRVARYAENIGKEEGGNLPVILCGAYLHNLTDRDSDQEAIQQSKQIATDILTRLKAKEAIATAVCELIEQQKTYPVHQEPISEVHILQDAKHLALLEENLKNKTEISDQSLFEPEQFHTREGRKLSTDLLAKAGL